MKKSITLDRDKIISIGPRETTILIKLYQDDIEIDNFEVYKCKRRKNILFCYAYNGKIKFVFETIKFAKYYANKIREFKR